MPFEAINGFVDPSVQFGLQFETLAEAPDDDADEAEAAPTPEKPPKRKRPDSRRTSVPREPAAGGRRIRRSAATQPRDKPADKGGAEVVRLDRFRKK